MIENNILTHLEHGPIPVSTLTKSVASKTSSSLPGVYKALHKLERESKLIVSNKEARLSLIEIIRERERLEKIEHNYIVSSSIRKIIKNKKGSKKKFILSSLIDLNYFANSIFMETREIKVRSEIYCVIPFDFFYFCDKEIDDIWLSKAKNYTIKMLTTLDTRVQQDLYKKRKADGFKISNNLNPLKLKDNVYYNLYDGWILKIVLDKKVSDKMLELIKNFKSSNLSHAENTELLKILKEESKHTFSLEYNEKRYNELTTKLKKYFT